MTTQEVANQLIQLCREGKNEEAVSTLYADNILSIEASAPPGGSRETTGLEAVKAKNVWWLTNHEVHSGTVEGPLVAEPFFSVTFKYDITFKPQNRRFQIEEVAVYKVEEGKVVFEQFFYKSSV